MLVIISCIVVLIIIGYALWYTDEETKYDMSFSAMQMEGYTDLEIIQELGPRPVNKDSKS